MRATIRYGLAIALLSVAVPAAAAESSVGTLTVVATFNTRTTLSVSSKVLHFDVDDPQQPATASIDFQAKARTAVSGEVVLCVEPLRTLEGPGELANAESVVFHGEGDGTLQGTVTPSSAATAGRWTGSGVRTGRLVFALRASSRGSYLLPVRFVLSAP